MPHSRNVATAVTLLLLLNLAGCGHTPTSSSHPPLALSADLSMQAEVQQVPFFKQRRKQCGAASLATVLAYRGAEINAEELEPLLYTPGRDGTLAIDMTAQARQQGFLVYPLQPSIHALLSEIQADNPVLVMQNLGLSWLPQWHFAVVIGYDLTDNTLLLRSGNEPRRRMAIKTFASTWERAQHWAVVITDAGHIPATAEPLRYLKANADLEHNHPSQAAMAYQAAIDHWPKDSNVDALARLGLFNIAFRRQHYREAADWLLRSPGPANATHWNNLAFSLLELNCPQQALSALHCAHQLQANNPTFLQSLEEIQQRAAEKSGTNSNASLCQIPACQGQAGIWHK